MCLSLFMLTLFVVMSCFHVMMCGHLVMPRSLEVLLGRLGLGLGSHLKTLAESPLPTVGNAAARKVA